jgi:hypothetical protein
MIFLRNIFITASIIILICLFLISPRFANTHSSEHFTCKSAYRLDISDDFKNDANKEKFTPLEQNFYNLKEDCIFNSTCQLKPNNNSFFSYNYS